MSVRVIGIKNAIKTVNNFNSSIEAKCDEACRQLTTIGADIASVAFGSSPDQDDKVVVSAVKISNGVHKVEAVGKSVCFLEFGAGVLAGEYEGAIPPSINVSPGSWSRTHGTGEFTKYNTWHHKKVKYTEIPPCKGMLKADNAIKERKLEIFRKVYENE